MTAVDATVRDVALPSGSPNTAAHSPRVRARTRARIAITQRGGKRLTVVRAAARQTAVDARQSWALTASPPTLTDWWAGRSVVRARIPGNHPALRWAAAVSTWTLGLPMAVVSTLLFAAAALLRWAACHPVRQWTLTALTAVTVAAAMVLTAR